MTSCSSCRDVESTLKMYKWVEADKQFLKNLMMVASMKDIEGHRLIVLPFNADQIRVRQVWLRSYTFTRANDKSLTHRTKRFLVKEKGYLQNKISMLVSLIMSAFER